MNDDRLTLRFGELESPDGGPCRNIAFSAFDVQPLGYADLVNARLHEPLTIPLALRNGTVSATDIPDLDTSRRYDARATVQSAFTSRAIGLIHGGWLPSALAATDPRTMVLVDRNVVTQIVGRSSTRKTAPADPDFLDLFHDRAVRLNPLLYVLEGNRRSAPDRALAGEQLDEVVQKLRAALPKAELVVGPGSLTGAMGLLTDTREALQRKQIFLLQVAPALASPVSARNRQDRWSRVIEAARHEGLALGSLAVTAVLSAVAVPNGGSPARRLLKFKPGYQAEDAYNALVDLRALELFMIFMALYPAHPIQLCTGDRDLALFWVGLQASGYRRIEDGFAFDLAPRDELFPDGWGEQWAQATRA